jgi:hypothetical protein
MAEVCSRSMTKNSVFVIRNHENRYLTKKHKWRSGNDKNILYRASEKDVALNELIEVNARDIMARLQLIVCELDERDQPLVEVLSEDPPEELEEDLAEQQAAEAFKQMVGNNDGKPALELVRNTAAS